MPDWRDSTTAEVQDAIQTSRSTVTKRNTMKNRDDSYGTFSSTETQSPDASYASTSRFTLDSVEGVEGDEIPLLKTTGGVDSERSRSTSEKYNIFQNLNPSLRLENAGCVARDHLASERTFLSYVRTSLAISMAGVVLGQMFLLSAKDTEPKESSSSRQVARPIAVSIILLGIFVLLVGVTRYFLNQNTLLKGNFSPARQSVAVISTLLVAVTAFIFFIIITDGSSSV